MDSDCLYLSINNCYSSFCKKVQNKQKSSTILRNAFRNTCEIYSTPLFIFNLFYKMETIIYRQM